MIWYTCTYKKINENNKNDRVEVYFRPIYDLYKAVLELSEMNNITEHKKSTF